MDIAARAAWEADGNHRRTVHHRLQYENTGMGFDQNRETGNSGSYYSVDVWEHGRKVSRCGNGAISLHGTLYGYKGNRSISRVRITVCLRRCVAPSAMKHSSWWRDIPIRREDAMKCIYLGAFCCREVPSPTAFGRVLSICFMAIRIIGERWKGKALISGDIRKGRHRKKISIDGAQNVEVSKPIPCENHHMNSYIMEAYTCAHRICRSGQGRTWTLLPAYYFSCSVSKHRGWWSAGLDVWFSKIGFGSVTIGGKFPSGVYKSKSLRMVLDVEEEEKARRVLLGV